MFRRADHVGVSVRHMGRAVAFHRDVTGMEVLFDHELAEPMPRLTGTAGAVRRSGMVASTHRWRQPEEDATLRVREIRDYLLGVVAELPEPSRG